MRPPADPRIPGPEPSNERPSVGLGASVTVHLLLVLAAAVAGRGAPDPGRPAEPTRKVELISLPPLPSPTVPRVADNPPRRVPRPQIRRGRPLPDEAYFRPETPPPDAVVTLPPAATAPAPDAPAPDQAIATAEAPDITIETEARRLFGPRRSGDGASAGPVASRSWISELTEDRVNDCVPRARPAREPGAPVDLGVVSGIVYREGSREPLGGAFLQILGTPYSTFADSRGAYSLSFDRSLVDDCRTQYVQVSKDGFAPRRLILSLGAPVSNDIPLSRR